MKKKVVFISLPMSGREEKDILYDIQKAKEAYLQVTGENIYDVAFVDNYERGKKAWRHEQLSAAYDGAEAIEPMRMPVWYLGIAMCNIADADLVMFYGNWKKARGCLVEEKVCELYDIPTLKLLPQPDVAKIDRD